MKEYSSLLITFRDNGKDFLVLQHRDDNPEIRFPNRHSLFGGGAKEGESPEEAIKREIDEELSLDLDNRNLRYLGKFNWNEDINEIIGKIQLSSKTIFLKNPLELIKRESEEIIDNLYLLKITKEKAESLKASEGKVDIVLLEDALSLGMVPLDKVMLLNYILEGDDIRVPFLDLKAQYKPLKDEIGSELDWVLNNTAFILGKKVQEFEKNFAAYCGKKHAIAVNSGTSALHLALLAKGIKSGDEIITVPNTFIATAEAISYTGARPVFVEIDKDSYNIDVSKIEEKITERTKAILPVHLYGRPADMDKIIEIAERHNLVIIEDCCQAHGATYYGKRVPVSDTGCFSFYPGKNLGAYGEGGAIVTNNDELAKRMRVLRDHGQEEKYHHKHIGYNYRMSGFQGAVLNVKLKYLKEWTRKRRENAKYYNELLRGIVETPKDEEGIESAYHLYIVRVKEREKLMQYLKEHKIDSGLHYPIPLHLQEAYKDLNIIEGEFPITEAYAKEILSLPMFPELTIEQINHVANKIKEFYDK